MSSIDVGDSTQKFRKLIMDFNESTTHDNTCRIQLFNVGEHLVLKIVGSASKAGYQDIAQRALEIITKNKARSLIVDLTLCEHLTSSPLGMIGMLLMTFKQRGGKVYVVTNSLTIQRSLRILGLDKITEIRENIEDIIS